MYQQVHAVGMIGGTVEIRTPAAQVFRAYLHVGSDIPKQVRYEILPVTVGIRFVGRIAVFGIKARHAVCARKEHLRTDVVLQACIPAQHGQRLHLSFDVGIGNKVHNQVADVVELLSDAFSVSGLPEHLPLPAQIESGGCLYAEPGDGMRLVALRIGVGHAADKPAHAQMAFAVPAVLCIGGEVRHAL